MGKRGSFSIFKLRMSHCISFNAKRFLCMCFLIISFIEGIFKICGLTMNNVRIRVNAIETSTDFEGFQF